jgi:hypothetical protein
VSVWIYGEEVKRPIAICLAILVSITSFNSQTAVAADLPPKMDYSSLVVPASLIAGEYLEITFRATDDVGINTTGPVVSIKSIEYPKLFFFFWNCYVQSGDRKDGIWKCKVPTEKTNPLGKYNVIVVITDTVGQYSVSDSISGYDTVALFEMREQTAAEKAAAEKVAAEKVAAEKVAAEKVAAEKAAAEKAAAKQSSDVVTDLLKFKSQITLLLAQVKTLEGKLKKICSAKPKPKGC